MYINKFILINKCFVSWSNDQSVYVIVCTEGPISECACTEGPISECVCTEGPISECVCTEGPISEDLSSVVAQLLFLQSESNKKSIHMYINRPGG